MGIDYCGSPCDCASARCDKDGCMAEDFKYSDCEDVPGLARAAGWFVPGDHLVDEWLCPEHASTPEAVIARGIKDGHIDEDALEESAATTSVEVTF